MSLPQELLGTIPGWITAGSMLTLLLYILRHRVAMRGLSNTSEADIRDHYADEVKALRGELKVARDELADCEAECHRKMKEIEEQLWGEKRQRVAEQIGLINLILNKVDAPELKDLRDMLERTQTHILSRAVNGRS